MTTEYEEVKLYYSAFPGKGIAWGNDQMVIVPSGWNMLDSGKRHITTNWTLFWYPNSQDQLEKVSFFKIAYVSDFIYLTYERRLRLEGSSEIQNRPKDLEALPGWIDLTRDWIDESFTSALDTEPDNSYIVAFQEFQTKNTSAAKYARSEKGKLTQKKYRQTDKAKEGYQKRSSVRKDKRDRFRQVRAWEEANPGKDLLTEAPQEILNLL